MSARDAAACARESELLAALGRGFLDAGLLAHLESCAACREYRRSRTTCSETAAPRHATASEARSAVLRRDII